MSGNYYVRSALTAAGLLAMAGVATAQTSTVVIAPSAPPPPRVETIPAPPQAQTLSWQAGHWAWNGASWNWVDGHYVQAPQPTAVWEPGHWQPQPSGGYIWVDGQWRG
jgi:hypothetical protein